MWSKRRESAIEVAVDRPVDHPPTRDGLLVKLAVAPSQNLSRSLRGVLAAARSPLSTRALASMTAVLKLERIHRRRESRVGREPRRRWLGAAADTLRSRWAGRSTCEAASRCSSRTGGPRAERLARPVRRALDELQLALEPDVFRRRPPSAASSSRSTTSARLRSTRRGALRSPNSGRRSLCQNVELTRNPRYHALGCVLGWRARAVVMRLSRVRTRVWRAQLNRRTERRHRPALVWSLPSSDSELIGLREILRKPKSLS